MPTRGRSRTIGHAALAAVTPAPEVTRRNIALVLGTGAWPSQALHITCVDAYTGERCVVTREAGATVARAVAASSAVPGIFAPQPIADRRCMDGGVSGTGLHLDLVAGAGRVLVLALVDGSDMTEGMMTSPAGGTTRAGRPQGVRVRGDGPGARRGRSDGVDVPDVGGRGRWRWGRARRSTMRSSWPTFWG